MKKFPFTAVEFAHLLLREVALLATGGSLPVTRGEFTLWTLAAKHWLASQAQEQGLRAIYTDQQGMSEFMLDLVWWQDGPGGSAILACEMEWGNTRDPRRNPGRVAEDFDKLLSFKAPFKLMIFDSYNKKEIQSEVIQELNRYLQEYGDHRIGEQYLVVDMSPLNTAWLCDINQSGEDASLQLIPLSLGLSPPTGAQIRAV